MRRISADARTVDATEADAASYLEARERRLKTLGTIMFLMDVPVAVAVVWGGISAFRAGRAGDRFRTMWIGSVSYADFAVIFGVAIVAMVVGGLWTWFDRRRKRRTA